MLSSGDTSRTNPNDYKGFFKISGARLRKKCRPKPGEAAKTAIQSRGFVWLRAVFEGLLKAPVSLADVSGDSQ